jgi:hypothetical protein
VSFDAIRGQTMTREPNGDLLVQRSKKNVSPSLYFPRMD